MSVVRPHPLQPTILNVRHDLDVHHVPSHSVIQEEGRDVRVPETGGGRERFSEGAWGTGQVATSCAGLCGMNCVG